MVERVEAATGALAPVHRVEVPFTVRWQAVVSPGHAPAVRVQRARHAASACSGWDGHLACGQHDYQHRCSLSSNGSALTQRSLLHTRPYPRPVAHRHPPSACSHPPRRCRSRAPVAVHGSRANSPFPARSAVLLADTAASTRLGTAAQSVAAVTRASTAQAWRCRAAHDADQAQSPAAFPQFRQGNEGALDLVIHTATGLATTSPVRVRAVFGASVAATESMPAAAAVWNAHIRLPAPGGAVDAGTELQLRVEDRCVGGGACPLMACSAGLGPLFRVPAAFLQPFHQYNLELVDNAPPHARLRLTVALEVLLLAWSCTSRRSRRSMLPLRPCWKWR